MRLLAAVALSAALPLSAGLVNDSCRPRVTIDGSRGSADFRNCPDAKVDVKFDLTLSVGSTVHYGYVSAWDRGQASFSLNDSVPPSRVTSGDLTIAGQRWTASIVLTGASSVFEEPVLRPRPPVQQQQQAIDPRTIEPANVNPSNASPANAAPAPSPTVPVDDDLVGLGDSDGLHAFTSAGNTARLIVDAWQLDSFASDANGLPLRQLSERGRIGSDGRLQELPFPVNGFTSPNDATFWAVGDGGKAYRRSGPAQWTEMLTGVTEDLYGVFTADGVRGWIAGANGLVLITNDGGATWVRHDTPAPDLRAIAFSKETGYAVGARGSILRSDDGGQTWASLTHAGKPGFPIPLPAPWYILLNLFVTVPALLLAAKGRPNEETIQHTDSIADQLVSDRALEAGDPDALNLRAIALGLSAFLRNEKTVPPLTIAVTGEWGSGKSSLMNLLRADLRDWGFRPVWFNAWHHQKEQHFLASLVQAIRRDAAPPWWHLGFRGRLLWTRCRQHPLIVSALLLVIAVLCGYERSHPDHQIVEPMLAALRGDRFWEFLITLPDALKDEFAFFLSVVSAGTALWKGLQSFAAKPAALLASNSSRPKLGDLDAEISFRGRFAPEFRDVTTALGDRALVLFIDDLDRCQPESVREMLEAVNFLITSGNCFVILGIDRMRVERYVNLAFGKAAEEEPNFAANYLDKLINIEVPIPAPNDKEALEILKPALEPEEQPAPWLERLRAGMATTWALKPVAVAAVLIWLGYGIGTTMHPPAPPAVAASPSTTPASAPVVTASLATLRPAGLKTGNPGEVLRGIERAGATRQWPIAVLLLAIGGVAAWLFTRRPGLVVHDSDEFCDALEAWQPLLMARNRTPRSLKRFINRVRYLAMRQRAPEEGTTMWRALRAAMSGRRIPPPPELDVDPIPEPVLVALAAMSYASRDGKNHDDALKLSEGRHVKRFGSLATEAWRPLFERIGTDVKVN